MAGRQNYIIESYGGGKPGVTAPGNIPRPDLSGLSRGSEAMASAIGAQADAQTKYLRGLGQLLGAVSDFSNTYNGILNERKERDADTEISELFRNRRMEVFSTRKLKDADNLLNDEDEWQKKTSNEMREKYGISTSRFKALWERHSEPYLDRMGAYQLEQQAAYDNKSRYANVEAGLDNLMTTRIGDLTPLKEHFARIDQLFSNDPKEAEALKDKAVQTAVKYWTRTNAPATVSWFRANREQVKEAIGKDFVKVSDVIRQAESQIQAEASHAEVLASRAERMARKQQQAYDDNAYNTMIKDILNGEFDASKMYAVADDPGISGETKVKIYNFNKRVQTDDFSQASDLVVSQALSDVYVGNMNEDKYKNILDSAAAGLIKPEDLKSIQAAMESKDKASTTETKPILEAASKYLENYYAPSGGLMNATDPQAKQRYMQVQQAMYAYAKGKDAKSLTKDLDFNDPESWLVKLMTTNKAVDGANILEAQPLKLTWTPTLPGAEPVVQTDMARKPNETFQQWRARTGK